MSNWRDQMIRDRLTLVADPDGLSFSLGEIFPNLSYPVVAALDALDDTAALARCAGGRRDHTICPAARLR